MIPVVSGVTQAERLARIEALLERALTDLNRVEQKQDEAKLAQDKDIAALAAWESKGRGLLIGVAISATGMGMLVSAKIGSLISAIIRVFK